jgi:Beta-lactamase
MVFERYFTGSDEVWSRPVGAVEFKADTLHDMRSVTKSIVGLLYGIALEQGLVPAPDQSLLAQFPEYPELTGDADKARLTIAHALTMTLALEWNDSAPWESIPTEVAMERAPDRYRFILERPMLGPPGKGWIYCGGATALLGRLIERSGCRPSCLRKNGPVRAAGNRLDRVEHGPGWSPRGGVRSQAGTARPGAHRSNDCSRRQMGRALGRTRRLAGREFSSQSHRR